MKMFAILAVFIITGGAYAQPAAIVPPAAKPIGIPKQQWPTYAAALDECRSTGKPLVVFYGKARIVQGMLIAESNEPAKGSILVTWDGYRGEWLPANASDRQIRQVAGLEVSREQARPFRQRRGEVQLRADADDLFRSLRNPDLKETLSKMQPYAPALYAQHPLSRTYRFAGAPFFNHAPRSTLEQKWVVPGGIEGVRGWSSVLLRGADNQVTEWVDHIDPADSISEIVHQRRYGKAEFADVLYNAAGEIFEVRFAVKEGGVWDRFVAEHHPARVPPGYRRLRSAECNGCHEKAGSGAYDAAYVPGGDTVLSEKLSRFEQ